MILEIGKYKIHIDVDKNKEFYKNAELITDGCSCDGCNNYVLATEAFPKEVKEFFDKIGVDIQKAAEIIVWCSENNAKSLYYGGFYHICGEVLMGEDIWEENGKMNMDELYSIADGYSVGFTRNVALLEEKFPLPVVQMEIDFHNVPWVLGERNGY